MLDLHQLTPAPYAKEKIAVTEFINTTSKNGGSFLRLMQHI